MTTTKKKRFVGCVVLACMTVGLGGPKAVGEQGAPAGKAKGRLTLEEIRKLRKKAAGRKRRIILHQDGRPWVLDQRNFLFPHIDGKQTHVDACSFSLIHQYNLCRFYRTKVGQPVPPGYVEELKGGPDALDSYIEFCRRNKLDAFWTMRWNDTHDASNTPNYRKRFAGNKFKQEHPEFLVGERKWEKPKSPDGTWYAPDFKHPPHGRWSSVDFTHPEVREHTFRLWEEVCQNYDVDGLLFDGWRHLTFFKSTAWGKRASEEEVTMMTDLLRRTRKMADRIGAERGRPILLAVRVPDSPAYCKGLGLDIETWMKEDLIDIWIATGYFRLQEWEETVKIARKYGVPVWASMDEVRTRRANCNSMEAYRARAMNMWNAGVDGILLFNFHRYTPPKPHFQLLFELGDPAKLAYLDKMYVPDPRGMRRGMGAGYWLKGGEQYFTRSKSLPRTLGRGKATNIRILVGDDVLSAKAKGLAPSVELRLQFKDPVGQNVPSVRFNGKELKGGSPSKNWLRLAVAPELVKKGVNGVGLTVTGASDSQRTIEDLQLWVRYRKQGTQ